ncbi:MAG: hypothetical protein AAF725_10730 [Acidobacteriota bacterium]
MATCGAEVAGKCYVNGPFTLSSSSPGAHHFRVCASGDVVGWGGCSNEIASSTGATFTVQGSDLPSDGFRRAYRFSACDSANNCTAWDAAPPAYVEMDQTGPTAPGPTTVACESVGVSNTCWVDGAFSASVTPASDSDSGVAAYEVCRSGDVDNVFGGCSVSMSTSAGTSFTVSGGHLPVDGKRRAYYFRARDRVGNWGAWNATRYVRVDRHDPTLLVTGSSPEWQTSATAIVQVADATGGAAANSGVDEVRYLWDTVMNPGCSLGTVVTNGTELTLQSGSHTLYACAKDKAGRIRHWSGQYRIDGSTPTAPGPTTVSCPHTNANDCWVRGSFVASVTPATGGGSVEGYEVCRSRDVGAIFAGCDVSMTSSGLIGTSITVSGGHLPADGMRRAYRFRAKGTNGSLGPWNQPRYVRIDRHAPRLSATQASTEWFEERTATISADDSFGGAAINSGLVEVRYRWNGALNPACTNGTVTSSGAALDAPQGDNVLNLCATDRTGNVATWSGTYRVDSEPPSAPGPTTVNCPYQTTAPNTCWVRGPFTASVTPATDNGAGIAGYHICRSGDVDDVFGGCNVPLAPNGTGGTSILVDGSHLPADSKRRAYYFRAKDGSGAFGPWNQPRYVRIDRYPPRIAASNASGQWFASRSATVTVNDSDGVVSANSGLAEARYRWNAPLGAGCTGGEQVNNLTTLTAPEGDNTLHLCARDRTGHVTQWTGPYRVDSSIPTLDSLNVSSSFWSVGDASTYQITARASDTGSGVRELRALINLQGSNAGNQRGNFSWRDQSLGYLWTADQTPCTGGGFASKRPDAFNPHTVTLVDCATSLVGSQRTVTFTVRPEASFGEFGPINDISFWALDFRQQAADWRNFDLNFASGSRSDAIIAVLTEFGQALEHNQIVPWGEVDLGASGGQIDRTLTVKNTAQPGSANLVLENDPSNLRLSGSSAFSLEGSLESPLPVGQMDPVELRLDTDQPGTHEGLLEIWHSDPRRPLPLRVRLRATVLAEPTVTRSNPDVIFRGSSPVITVEGSNLQGASVYIATDPYGGGQAQPRGFPTAQLVSVNSQGTVLQARINAQASNLEGFYNLAIETPGGAAGVPFRVVTQAPEVDVFTPSQPVQGEIHVLTIGGVNLAGADVVPMNPAVKILDLDNSNDRSLMGMLYVENNVPVTDIDILIDGPGGRAIIPMTIESDRSKVKLKTEALEIPGRSTEADVPNVLLQKPVSLLHLKLAQRAKASGASQEDLRQRDLIDQPHFFSPDGTLVSAEESGIRHRPAKFSASSPNWDDAFGPFEAGGEESREDGASALKTQRSPNELEEGRPQKSLCLDLTVNRTQGFSAVLFSLTDQLGNPITREVLNRLTPGSRLQYDSMTVAVRGFLELEFTSQFCATGLTDFLFCIRGGIEFMVPLVGGQRFDFSICLGGEISVALEAEGFISNSQWSSDSNCGSASELNPQSRSGLRSGEIQVDCCGRAELSLQTDGVVFEQPFSVEAPAATIAPYCPITDPNNFRVVVRAFIPANFARSPNPLDVCFSGAVTRLRVFGGDDRLPEANPERKDLPPLNPLKYRQMQEVSLVPEESRSPQGFIPGSKFSRAGETLTYEAVSTVSDDNIGGSDWDWPNINDCFRFHTWDISTFSTNVIDVTRLEDDKVRARFRAAANNPLSSFSPDIDWDITVILEKPNPRTVAWTVQAEHDCIPGYELYINDQLVYRFLPPGSGGASIPASEFLLCLPAPLDEDNLETGVFEF